MNVMLKLKQNVLQQDALMENTKVKDFFQFVSFTSIKEERDYKVPVYLVRRIVEQIAVNVLARSLRERQKTKYTRCISKHTDKQRRVQNVRSLRLLQNFRSLWEWNVVFTITVSFVPLEIVKATEVFVISFICLTKMESNTRKKKHVRDVEVLINLQ
jgi:hypothetical protein